METWDQNTYAHAIAVVPFFFRLLDFYFDIYLLFVYFTLLQLTVTSNTGPYWLGGFFAPRSFLTAVAQDYCRAAGLSIDQLHVRLYLAEDNLEGASTTALAGAGRLRRVSRRSRATTGSLAVADNVSGAVDVGADPAHSDERKMNRATRIDESEQRASTPPAGVEMLQNTGVTVRGLHLQGAVWGGQLAEALSRQPITALPPAYVGVSKSEGMSDSTVLCPVFRTPRRADDGNDGFVVALALPAGPEGVSHWIARGITVLLEE